MALTPEEIEKKEFAVGLRGYDKDEVQAFLAQVAVEYRTVQTPATSTVNGSGEAISDAEAEARAAEVVAAAEVKASSIIAEAEARAVELRTQAEEAPRAPGAAGNGDDWSRLGEQVATLMRTAKEQADTLKAEAEAAAAEHRHTLQADAERTREEAERYAADLRSNAESWAEARQGEADADREEARKALSAAQDDALVLVADAQKRADRMLQATELRAKQRADEVVTQARSQLDQLLQVEKTTYERLAEANQHLQTAVEAFGNREPLVIDDTDDLVVLPDTEAGRPAESPEPETAGAPSTASEAADNG